MKHTVKLSYFTLTLLLAVNSTGVPFHGLPIALYFGRGRMKDTPVKVRSQLEVGKHPIFTHSLHFQHYKKIK